MIVAAVRAAAHRRRDPAHGRSGHKDTLLRRWEEGLVEGIELLGPDSPAGLRLEETRAFFAFIRTELPRMLERWREQRRTSAIARPNDGRANEIRS